MPPKRVMAVKAKQLVVLKRQLKPITHMLLAPFLLLARQEPIQPAHETVLRSQASGREDTNPCYKAGTCASFPFVHWLPKVGQTPTSVLRTDVGVCACALLS